MKRKESKIPLFLALVVLGAFVFWAIGYVAKNKTQPVSQQPTDLARPAVINGVQPEPIAQQSVAPASQEPVMAPAAKVAADTGPTMNATDNTNVDVISGRPIYNRKIMGIARETSDKH